MDGARDDVTTDDAPLLTVRQRRRDALLHDALLFATAFTGGALVYVVARVLVDDSETFWGVGLSKDLILAGLVAGEVFLLLNNGVRQGLRGHSIGKHRVGLRVVDVTSGRATGVLRGLLRGLILAVLLDLALAVVPIGLPTVLRRLTPDEWHVGGAAYVALLVILVPLLLPTDRGLADRLTRTRVEEATGAGAVTTPEHRTWLLALDVIGLIGVLTIVTLYLAFFWPLIWQLPSLL